MFPSIVASPGSPQIYEREDKSPQEKPTTPVVSVALTTLSSHSTEAVISNLGKREMSQVSFSSNESLEQQTKKVCRASEREEDNENQEIDSQMFKEDPSLELSLLRMNHFRILKETPIAIEQLHYPDESVYKGPTLNGKAHGLGRLSFADGSVYEGNFIHDQRTGKGIFTSKPGEYRYEEKGHFVNGRLHGKGKRIDYHWMEMDEEDEEDIDKSTETYKGDFVNGLRHGKGKVTYDWEGEDESNADDFLSYEGEFAEGKMHGKGYLIYRNGEIYKGSFENDEECGVGKYTFPNGAYYVGDFKSGRYEGKGFLKVKMHNQDNSFYEGDFKNGQFHGKGTYFFSEDELYRGEFKNDFFEGFGSSIFKNRNVFFGEYKNNLPRCGTLILVNGDTYSGLFEIVNAEAQPTYGIYTYANGKSYARNFKDEPLDGLDPLKFASGRIWNIY